VIAEQNRDTDVAHNGYWFMIKINVLWNSSSTNKLSYCKLAGEAALGRKTSATLGYIPFPS